ncbi:MAG TPA: hypothetical protein VJV40_04945 [Thermodesulfobacteriota bacterium]|jgi:hypothetical protein|nr:hypothetical protein [Thermodesulfobacteriota bacterium]
MKKAAACLLIVFVLFGCGKTAGLIQKDDQESLAKSSDLYYKLMMWKYYEKAAQFVDPDKHKEFEAFVLANEKDLNITGYEIKEMVYLTENEAGEEPAQKETGECVIRILYTYYKYPSVSEKSVMAEDTWIKKGKLWYNSSDFGPGTFN